jgi:hypothetical protein
MCLEAAGVDDRGTVPVPVVVVPARIVRWHPLLAATRSHVGRSTREWVDTRRQPNVMHLHVTGPNVGRALRCVQALLDAALARGHSVVAAKTYRCDGGVVVMVGDDPVEVVVVEPTKRSPHELTAAERTRVERGEWNWAPACDFAPTGRLELRAGHDHYQKPLATDRDRWKLEDRLGHALVRIEALADDHRVRREEQVRVEREREARRIAAEERARLERIEQHRRDHAIAQVEHWRLARDLRQLVAEVLELEEPADPDWLTWIGKYADQIDPTRRPFTRPDPPGSEQPR